MRRERLDVGLLEGTDHDSVEVARKHDGGVLDGLAAAELQIAGRQVEPHAAELVDPDLERDARAGRGLLEDHPERAAGEEVVLLPRFLEALQLVSEVEHLEQLGSAPVGDPGERPALEAVGDGDHPGDPTAARACPLGQPAPCREPRSW